MADRLNPLFMPFTEEEFTKRKSSSDFAKDNEKNEKGKDNEDKKES